MVYTYILQFVILGQPKTQSNTPKPSAEAEASKQSEAQSDTLKPSQEAKASKQSASFGDQQALQSGRGQICSTKMPSLPLLYEFNVPEQVGTRFPKFGTLLLNDQTGTQVDNIEDELRGNPERINKRILQYWLQGKGQPVTWKTLIETLRACSLNGMADQIQASIYI